MADSGGAGHLNLTTRYEYDILGRLTEAISPKGDTTRYWYDPFGRVRYKRQPDIGTVSYAYDPVGNIRFSQNQEQADAAYPRVTFNEYDDLNRVTLVGEAQLQPLSRARGKKGDRAVLHGADTSFGRATDDLDGSVLHDGGASLILTANKTLWQTPTASVPVFWAPALLDSVICPLAPDTLLGERNPPPGWYLRHPAQFWTPVLASAQAADFENVAAYPSFARMAVSYDTLPRVAGAVWGAFPTHAMWDALAPGGKVRNLRGHEAAVAYREHGGQPFHYAVMSYDERGRVEALLRWTENLGFDAVYYTYNSMNAVTSVRVVDPMKQYVTWYGYDHNGRTDSVWTLLKEGFGRSYPRWLVPPARPAAADIVYTYTRTGQVDTMRYGPVGILVTYAYNHRKWLDSMTATQGGSPLFRQALTFDPGGQIVAQRWRNGTAAEVTHRYGYDSVGRLTSWYDGVDTTTYQYDVVGNPIGTWKTGSLYTETHAYLNGRPNQVSQQFDAWTGGSLATAYGYDRNGAVTGMSKVPSSGKASLDSLVYSYRGLTEGYLFREYNGPSVGRTAEWRYRYSAGGEREQKRLYMAQDANHQPIGRNAWVYYLLGGSKEQLAVYHGQESPAPLCAGQAGNEVYLYPVEYLSYGNGSSANIITRPDVGFPNGRKEFRLVDHLGSVRVSTYPVTTHYAYDPWGEPLAGSGTDSRLTYIGKEVDLESMLGDFGARKRFGKRFLSADPLWEKYRGWSPYVYSQDSPLLSSDASGLAVDVTRMMWVYEGDDMTYTQEYVTTLVKELTKITGLSVYVSKYGMLEVDHSKGVKGGSETARSALLKMIGDRNTMELKVGSPDFGSRNSVDNVVYLNPWISADARSNAMGLNRLTASMAMTMFHEYKHTDMGGDHPDPSRACGFGAGMICVPDEFANQIRRELGPDWGQRYSYFGIQVGDKMCHPYTLDAVNSLNKGQLPTSGYVFFYVR